MIAHEHRCAIAAEAFEYQGCVDLFPNALEHRAEVWIGTFQSDLRDRRPEIKRIVTTIESRHLSPRDHSPIGRQPHDDRDTSERSMRNQHDQAIAPLRG